LLEHGHHVVATDLPCADPAAGLEAYSETALDAALVFGTEPVVVVAQSLAGMIAPVVATRRPVCRIVLVAAMIPGPGETANEWAAATGQPEAQGALLARLGIPLEDRFDPELVFVHDLDPDLRSESARHVSDQQVTPTLDPCPIAEWPAVPTHVIAATDDRFFPLEFMQRQARERLGIEPDTIPGGHLAVLSHGPRLVEMLLALETLPAAVPG
jgi:pimeloyl-ACP methyl ester carboxylesterase